MTKTITTFLILFIFVTEPNILFAQSTSELQNSYQYGKKLIEEGKFKAALETLKPLLRQPQTSYLREYGTYFYALAAQQSGDATTAKNFLTQFITQYPKSKAINDAWLLLGASSFETKDPAAALKALNEIKDESLKNDITAQKKNYLNAYSLAELKSLHKNFPSDQEVGLALAQKLNLNKVQLDKEDKDLLEMLIIRYPSIVQQITNINPENPTKVDAEIIKKKSYSLALALPFQRNETDLSKAFRRSQFAFDMYQGVLLAQEKLKLEGIDLQVFAFDTEKSAATIQNILPKMASADVILGPLFPEHTPMVADFAKKYDITVVNPLMNDAEMLKKYPNLLLTEPTYATQGKMAAQFAVNKLINNNAIIYYGLNLQDSLVAFAYKKEIEAQKGKVLTIKKIGNAVYSGIVGDLDRQFSPTDSVHIFVSTSENVAAANIISAAITKKRSFPIIANKEWLDFAEVSYERYENTHVHFIINDFVAESEEKRNFMSRYVEKMNMIPSKFAFVGYENTYFLGKMLHKYGKNFRYFIKDEGLMLGKLLAGFDFSSSNDNQCVTICHFEEGTLVGNKE